ncbi:E3 ubiquitin-protein ligase RHA1B-like [Rutidosis leptorrhynchoides]|uniref:E3 ubiquitin-protein ligase RHA1B-like n=1 Tax=Rutidosis leptorrhynchoides TaxID=125765 RepID=UPI003A990EAC
MTFIIEEYSDLIISHFIYKAAVILTIIRWVLSWTLNHRRTTIQPSTSSCDQSGPCSSSLITSSQVIRDNLVLTTFGDVVTSGTDTCAVCLAQLRDQDLVRELRNCCHVFHKECIDRWIDYECDYDHDHDENHKSCPLCRAPLLTCSQTITTNNWAKNEPSWAVERILYLFGDDLLM